MNNTFAKVIVSYVDTLNSTVPHDVFVRYVAPYYVLRGSSILSKPTYRLASPIISIDEMSWLTRELEKRQYDAKLYDWKLIQDERLPRGKIEFHYKPMMSAAQYFLQFDCKMTEAELDEMYKQLQEAHRAVHVVDPFSSVYSSTAKSSDIYDYKVVCDEKQDDVIASASEGPSILQQVLDAHNSGEDE